MISIIVCGGEEIVAPIEERVQALIEAIEATEAHPGLASSLPCSSTPRALRESRPSPTRLMPSSRNDSENRKPIHRQILIFQKMETRISIDYAQNSAKYRYPEQACPYRYPPFWRCQKGLKLRLRFSAVF
jgi:hypothetical protein